MARTPDDPTKAQVWVTKGLDDLDFEFYFPQGPKGDPGGIAYGTALDAVNLNDIVTSGVYRTTATSSLAALDNYPVALAGVLVVHERLRDATTYQSVFQEYFVADSVNGARVRYVRYLYGKTSWTPWRAYVSQRVDQTAGRAIYTWDDVNKREQLTYGDTGWRNITSSVATVTAGAINLRRVGQIVELNITDLTVSDASASSLNFAGILPVGFRPYHWGNFNTLNSPAVSSISRGVRVKNTGDVTIYNYVAGDILRATMQWSVVETWPATLPGTATASIPNV